MSAEAPKKGRIGRFMLDFGPKTGALIVPLPFSSTQEVDGMLVRKCKRYDDLALASDIASGHMTAREVAVKHGLSVGYVRKIACGLRRRDLTPVIRQGPEAMQQLVRDRATRLAEMALSRLGIMITKALDDKVETQRRAAVDLLKVAMAEASKTKGKPVQRGSQRWQPPGGFHELAPELRHEVAKALGGPGATKAAPSAMSL